MGQNGERGGEMLTPRNLLLGILTSVPILMKIDQKMQP